MASRAPGRRGPTDPGRRDRIAAAALDIALERGVNAVSHRAVATAAGVPLGSTTYHFRDLDDLLAAAVDQAAAAWQRELDDWSSRVAAGIPLADAVCDLVLDSLRHGRARVIAEYELYLAAVHRPGLVPASRAWAAVCTTVFARHTDPRTAEALSVAMDGVILNSLATGRTPDRETVLDLLRRLTA
jgi:DNA-binding transcriptional regulator YbjK